MQIEQQSCMQQATTIVKQTIEQPVCAYTEWDPLEEVIVGVVEGAAFPPWHITLQATMPTAQHHTFKQNASKNFPLELIQQASKELDHFAYILEQEGVTVKRPEKVQHTTPYASPDWGSSGLYHAMPRDVLLVIGNEIIECPLAWRSRYFETFGYRTLIKNYFKSGARWSTGPKPQLLDDLYKHGWQKNALHEDFNSVITEHEPVFEAADFLRFGSDIVAQKSHVTNDFGIEWLRRHLGSEYSIHVLEFADAHRMHLDATIMPLAPGKLLVNPLRATNLPALFRDWDILEAPQPIIPDEHPLYMTSKWINMNIIMLDEERVVVEKQDEPMIRCMKKWGFKPILCDFRAFNSFGGSFHCATIDVRRRGKLQSYLQK